jgi:hypothetical protein
LRNAASAATDFYRAKAAASRERGAAADERGAAAEEVSKCVVFLTEGVKAGRFDKAEILERAGGKLAADNACPIAVKFYNYQRKAEGARPAVK